MANSVGEVVSGKPNSPSSAMVLDIDIGEEVLDDEMDTQSSAPAPKESADDSVKTEVKTDAAEPGKADGDPAPDVGYGTSDTRFETIPSSSSSTFGGGSTAFTNTLSSTSFGAFGGFGGSASDTQQSPSETNKGLLPTPGAANGSKQQGGDFRSLCTNLIKEQLKDKTPQNLAPVVHSICEGLLGEKYENSLAWKNLRQRLTSIFQSTWSYTEAENGYSENSHKNNSKAHKRNQAKDTRFRQSPYQKHNVGMPGHGTPHFNTYRDSNLPLPDARSIICNRLLNRAQENVNQMHSIMKPPLSTILTDKQMNNPLTTIVTDSKYPEVYLKPEQFELFKSAVREEINKTPVSEWPKFERSFSKGGVFIFIAAEQAAQDWLRNKISDIKPWDNADLRVNDTSILIKMVRVQTLIDQIEEPSKILERLQLYNPALKTETWMIINEQKINESLVLDLNVPEAEVCTLESLDCKPFYDLGRLYFQILEPQPCHMA